MKVLFAHQKLESYVAKDLEILRAKHDVRVCEFIGAANTTPQRLSRDILSLARGTVWSDLTFSWFGKLHAFFAVLFSKMLGKPAIVVAGGEDTTKWEFGQVHYGLYWHPVKRWFAHVAFRGADLVLAVSKQTYREAVDNVRLPLDRLQLIYHGFDADSFETYARRGNEAAVATISNLSWENWELKGVKLFVETAKLLPNIRFYVVGPAWDESLQFWQERMPKNVVLTGGLYGADLLELLSRLRVYVQTSYYESFGCAVAEAMLCGCVPVVTRLASLPEVVGDCGFYLDVHSDSELAASSPKLADLIKQALLQPELGQQARRRVKEHFPLSKRRDALLRAVESLAADRKVRS